VPNVRYATPCTNVLDGELENFLFKGADFFSLDSTKGCITKPFSSSRPANSNKSIEQYSHYAPISVFFLLFMFSFFVKKKEEAFL